jgi:hypothetical protein
MNLTFRTGGGGGGAEPMRFIEYALKSSAEFEFLKRTEIVREFLNRICSGFNQHAICSVSDVVATKSLL